MPLYVELHVDDFGPVKAFYGALGFQIAWESPGPDHAGYLVMQLDENVIAFWPGNESVRTQPYFQQFPSNTVPGYGVEIVCMVLDLELLYKRACALSSVVQPLSLRSWGKKDFRMVDPAGYYIRFTERYNVLDPTYRAL